MGYGVSFSKILWPFCEHHDGDQGYLWVWSIYILNYFGWLDWILWVKILHKVTMTHFKCGGFSMHIFSLWVCKNRPWTEKWWKGMEIKIYMLCLGCIRRYGGGIFFGGGVAVRVIERIQVTLNIYGQIVWLTITLYKLD